MKKVFLLLLVIIFAYFLYQKLSAPPQSPENPDLILYWGQGCPHCENVKEYIADNQLDQKLGISQKEVYYDKNNQNELNQKATACGLDVSGGIGVPLAYFTATSDCLIGDTPIIDRLKSMVQ